MTMKKLSSVIIGPQSDHSSPTGNPSTEAGALTLNTSERSQALTLLRSMEPKDTDKALLTSLQQLQILLIPKYTKSHEIDRYDISYKTTAENYRLGFLAIQEACVPMPVDEMAKSLLAAMMLMVKPSGESPQDAAMRCNLYATQMQDWPADIFLKVLNLVTKYNTFWPAFSDFYKEYEWLVRNRLKMREALHLCMK